MDYKLLSVGFKMNTIKKILSVATFLAIPSLGQAAITLPDVDCNVSGQGSLSMYDTGLQRDITRTFTMFTPCNVTGKIPVVMTFHHAGVRGKAMQSLTGFNTKAKFQKFIAVYPDSLEALVWDTADRKLKNKKLWNDGRGFSGDSGLVDDVGFVNLLANELATQSPLVDRSRVYVTGIASGASLVQRLACETPQNFAAFAPVASTLSKPVSSQCNYNGSINMLMLAGTADPYNDWCSHSGSDAPLEANDSACSMEVAVQSGGMPKEGETHSFIATRNFWATRMQCSNPQSAAEINNKGWDNTSVVPMNYNCNNGNDFKFFAIKAGGHAWAGKWSIFSTAFNYNYLDENNNDQSIHFNNYNTYEIKASDEIWNFFKSH
jgi:poly(3-hydroxybutyrate) depolymerase